MDIALEALRATGPSPRSIRQLARPGSERLRVPSLPAADSVHAGADARARPVLLAMGKCGISQVLGRTEVI
jgi:hypothetical protein